MPAAESPGTARRTRQEIARVQGRKLRIEGSPQARRNSSYAQRGREGRSSAPSGLRFRSLVAPEPNPDRSLDLSQIGRRQSADTAQETFLADNGDLIGHRLRRVYPGRIVRRRVLGIDVASASWSANGSALIEYDDTNTTFQRVVPGAVVWPCSPLTPVALAEEIDQFARRHCVVAVALDGPQGWRDPATDEDLPGVGRRCEYECRTQGKTGVYPVTYPRNQRPWIEFSVDLFVALLARPGVVLANSGSMSMIDDGYVVLECFPTSTWRASGLRALPGKGKRPDLSPYLQALSNAFGLPPFATSSHDELQAVVAALAAVGALGGPASAIQRGEAATMIADSNGGRRRLEGFIWDARPCATPGTTVPMPPAVPTPLAQGEGVVYVTKGVLKQVNRSSDSKQAQIAFSGIAGATKANPRRVTLRVNGDDYALVVGDSHAIWPSHQDAQTAKCFERLFALLADRPGQRVPASIIDHPSA